VAKFLLSYTAGWKKLPQSGIVRIKKIGCFAIRTFIQKTKSSAMKLLFESIKNFWEGFISFYTTIFKELKSW